jgi:hypothetical protein
VSVVGIKERLEGLKAGDRIVIAVDDSHCNRTVVGVHGEYVFATGLNPKVAIRYHIKRTHVVTIFNDGTTATEETP